MPSLLECYSNAGQRLMPEVASAGLRFTGQQSTDTEVVRLLLEHGADTHVRDESGKTPSEWVSREGHHEVVELLSDCDASSVKK
jgi:hypothetical protein